MNFYANNACSCALAIFCEGTLFYENPLYRACFGDDFIPPPAEEKATPVFFETPFPYVTANTLFAEEKKAYCLFAALPFAEGDSRDVILSRFHGMLLDVRKLFSHATGCPRLHTIAMQTLFRTVCLLIGEEFSLSFCPSGDTPEIDEYTHVDIRGLLMALGILLPPMLADSDAEIDLHRLPDNWKMSWHGGKPPTHPFLRRLATRLCQNSGVSLEFEENGFSLFFPIYRPKVLFLHTPKPDKISGYLRLGCYLGE